MSFDFETHIRKVPWAFGSSRLNTSQKLDAHTSTPSTPSSMAALLLTECCLFSGKEAVMRKRLTLSRETLRVLDAQELSMVVGGSGSGSDSDHGKGHGKTGKHGSCKADKTKKKDSCH